MLRENSFGPEDINTSIKKKLSVELLNFETSKSIRHHKTGYPSHETSDETINLKLKTVFS